MRHLYAYSLPQILCAALTTSTLAGENAAQAPREDADIQKFQATIAFGRNRNAQDYSIISPNRVDDARYVEIGGIQQWITIRSPVRAGGEHG